VPYILYIFIDIYVYNTAINIYTYICTCTSKVVYVYSCMNIHCTLRIAVYTYISVSFVESLDNICIYS